MTTKFDTREAALNYGILCAQGEQDIRPEDLKRLEDTTMNQFGHTFPIELYEVKNSKGEIGHLGIENFRDGYALWLLTPGSPYSVRV